MVLGMCPTLAITNSVRNAVAMGLATTFVIVMLQRPGLRDPEAGAETGSHRDFIAIIATTVTVVDYLVKAISIPIYKALGAVYSADRLQLPRPRAGRSLCGQKAGDQSRCWTGSAWACGFTFRADMSGHGPGSAGRRDVSGFPRIRIRTSNPGCCSCCRPADSFRWPCGCWCSPRGPERSAKTRHRSARAQESEHVEVARMNDSLDTYLYRRAAD